MPNLWQCLEVLGAGQHVRAEWARCSGEHFAPLRAAFLRDTEKWAKFIPCPHGCGCEHEVLERAGGALFGVCRCEPWSCDDIPLTADEAVLLALNTAKLGRGICKALECDVRERKMPLPMTWQIGAKFANGVPVFLTVQNEGEAFRRVVADLSARQRQGFILLAPTSRLLDAESRELLDGSRAGFFDLESNLNVSENGKLAAKRSPGELFQAFAPDAQEPVAETVAAQIFALVEKLDANERLKNPSVLQVFRLYCGRGLAAQAVADKCGCVKATVLNRLKLIRKATGKKPDELRAYSPFFKRVEEAISPRAIQHRVRGRFAGDENPRGQMQGVGSA